MAGRRRNRDSSAPEATEGAGAGRGTSRSHGPGGADPDSGPDADPEAVARLICLRLLTTAPRTKAQLAAALRHRGVPDDAAETVLARFAEVKLIDDAMFARAWVDSRHYGRGLASRALGAELRQRGVARDDIQAALGQLSPDVEAETARELVARRMPGTVGMPVPARMRRLVGVLARKGYSSGLAYRIVREALEAEAGDDPVPSFEFADLAEPDAENDAAKA
ncbi:MAG TPA: regulatory protein RecX [Streptosporangiaceae bacterium]|nr:regulatory protein RecX [Streptosporangiaceae bacterium]